MLQYDFTNDQSEFSILRINIAKPTRDFVSDFTEVGRAPINLKKPYVDFPHNATVEPGGSVPIIYRDAAHLCFDEARWGHAREDKCMEYFRRCEGQSIGYPVLIPATSIDFDRPRGQGLRVSDPKGQGLFIAAMRIANPAARRIQVVCLVQDAGPDIAPYFDWEPLLIPKQALPEPGILAYLSAAGARHLWRPSVPGDLRVEPL